MKKIFTLIISVLLVFFSLISITYAWLTLQTSIDLPLSGSVFTAYFHCGTGTEQDPYVITKPQHLYNLTMLYQHLNGFDEDQVYIEIGCDGNCGHTHNNDLLIGGQATTLDMSDYDDFVPIGTYAHPFKGILNGNNFIVDSLSIVGQSEQGVGIFGYVTNEANISDIYFDNLIIDISNCSNNSYVGYIAGYIEDATCFENVYINNCELCGTASNFQSEWGYFGKCDNAATLEQFIKKANGEGQGNDWGGSIDMLSLNQRIRYFLNNVSKTGLNAGTYNYATAVTYNKSIYTKSSSNVFRYYVDDYQSYSTYSGSTYNNDPASNQIIYRFVGGANNARATTSNPTSTSGTYFYDIPASYVPLLTKGESEGYAVEEGNTGYFAGDLMHGSNTLRTASYANSYIGNSYANGELEVLSNSTVSYNANNYKKINNGHTNNLLSGYSADIAADKYPGYANAYQKMCGVLSSSTFVQGLHFTGSTISSSSTTTVPKAYINGQLINNYKTLRSSVDFYAKENGSIKFFAGSYYNTVGTNSDSFFSLHTVTRSGNNITTNQIFYIYANTNEATKKTYPHLYYDENNNLIAAGYGNNVTKGDLEFDMRWLHNAPPVANAVYYFEIPVNAGEFALGSVAANKTKGTYLMYLDIGSNGASDDNDKIDDFGSVEYRTNPNTIDHSILILRYDQNSEIDFSIKVEFTNNTYTITTSENITVIIAILDDDYTYIFDDETLSSTTGQYIRPQT